MTVVTLAPLDYYARIGAALFPIPYGSKAPHGLVPSFKHDFSTDPAQWRAWRGAHPNCNFGIVAFASNLVIVDIDTSGPEGRAEAWAMWCALCAEWGVAPLAPHIQSARGGWHVLCATPDGVDASRLRQPDAVRGRINIRCVGYTVAAGSYYEGTAKGEESGWYQLLTDAPPHPAPEALIRHCTRADRPASNNVGTHELADVRTLYEWLAQRDAFADYESWLQAGMVARAEFGDAGFALWEVTHDETVDPDLAAAKWESFADTASSDSVTLASLLKRASDMGWRGNVRKSAQAMFGAVAAIAAAAGATLASAPPGGSLFAGQEALAERCKPILDTFLAATSGAPSRPPGDCTELPAAMAEHGLFASMNASIARTLAMAARDSGYKWSSDAIKSPMAVLKVLHQDVFDTVRRQIESNGRRFPSRSVNLEAKGIEEEVQRDTALPEGDWVYDARTGLPESDNPDNLRVFMGIIGAELRQNVWYSRPEIRGFEWSEWTPMQDVILAKLKRRALRTKTRFRISSEFLKEQVMALADDNRVDPVLDHVNSLVWDGVPRIHAWLSATCGVPAGDPYFEAVSRNVIGGMVKRIREPGAKHDEVMILMGPQGCGKSNLTKALAIQPEYHTDSVTFDGTPQNVIPQLFGKIIVELSELDGMAKKEVQSIKRFISSENDNFTAKYQAFATDRPRRCIFVGTSNEHNPLVDITGNRRFLPVRVEQRVDTTWLKANIGQMLAEAAALHAGGETFAIPEDVWDVAASHQEGARSVSDIEARLHHWFGETTHTAAAYVTVPDLADLSEICGWRNLHAFRNQILRSLGFREEKPYIDGKRTNVFVRSPKLLARHIEGLTRYRIGKDQMSGRAIVTIRGGGGTQPAAPAPFTGLVPPPPY